MAKIPKSDAPPAANGGWSLAAALGLLAVAFLWDRLDPPENVARLDRSQAFPKKQDGDRHASPAAVATEGEDRGRLADAPSEIPLRGWKDILLRVYGNISEHRLLALAAGMTYYSLLAIFPALAALVAIYGLFWIRAASPSTSTRSPDSFRAAPSTSPEISSRASPRRAIRRSVSPSPSAWRCRSGARTRP